MIIYNGWKTPLVALLAGWPLAVVHEVWIMIIVGAMLTIGGFWVNRPHLDADGDMVQERNGFFWIPLQYWGVFFALVGLTAMVPFIPWWLTSGVGLVLFLVFRQRLVEWLDSVFPTVTWGTPQVAAAAGTAAPETSGAVATPEPSVETPGKQTLEWRADAPVRAAELREHLFEAFRAMDGTDVLTWGQGLRVRRAPENSRIPVVGSLMCEEVAGHARGILTVDRVEDEIGHPRRVVARQLGAVFAAGVESAGGAVSKAPLNL